MILFWSLARSTWRLQGSAIYYVDAIAELLIHIEARVFAIGGDDPCFHVEKITTMRGQRGYFLSCE